VSLAKAGINSERAIADKLTGAGLQCQESSALQWHVPETAVLKIIEEATPRETSTDKIEAALNRLLEDPNGRRTTRPRIKQP
jgi:hypothetical protein